MVQIRFECNEERLMNILEITLLKFGVHKLPLSKTAYLRNKISSKYLVVLYIHAEVNWPEFSWSHRQKGNYGQTAEMKFYFPIGSFFFFYLQNAFFCTEALYNVKYWNISARQNYSSFHAKQQATRCELAVAPTIDLGQFLIILQFQWMPGLSLELFQLPFADLID